MSQDAALLRLGYEPTLRRKLGFGALLVYGLLFFVPMAPVAVFGIVVNRSGGVPVLAYIIAAAFMGLSALSYREMALRARLWIRCGRPPLCPASATPASRPARPRRRRSA